CASPAPVPGPPPESRQPDSAGPRARQSVWCTRDCRPATPASLVSPCHNSGSTPAGSPPPGRPVCPHRRGPVSSPSCDRRTCGERAHRCHRRFFPPALEPQNPHLRGTKDSADCGTRTKAREAICVCKTPQFSHTGIMPDFLAREISSKPCPEPFSRTERYNFTHSNPRRAKKYRGFVYESKGDFSSKEIAPQVSILRQSPRLSEREPLKAVIVDLL